MFRGRVERATFPYTASAHVSAGNFSRKELHEIEHHCDSVSAHPLRELNVHRMRSMLRLAVSRTLELEIAAALPGGIAMTFTTRLCAFAALALAGVIAWQWNATSDAALDATALAVQQFENNAATPNQLQVASLTQNWWPLVLPALLLLLCVVMFWDDFERWWKNEEI
jgi:hypothetical protein